MENNKLDVLQQAFKQINTEKNEITKYLVVGKEAAEIMFSEKYDHIKKGSVVLVELFNGDVINVSEYN